MTKIRVIATAAIALGFAFLAVPVSAGPCDDDKPSCPQPSSPMALDSFMKTWKPVSAGTKQKKKYSAARTTRHSAKREAAERREAARREAAEKRQARREAAATREAAARETRPAENTQSPALPTQVAAAGNPAETDGVAVTSFKEANETDAASANVQVVAFNDVNEIDMAAPAAPPPPAAETVGQAISPPAEGCASWIGKLLLAAAATLALAGATRLLAA